jgi:hypothetical protein
MTPRPSLFGHIVLVNLKLGYAVCLGGFAHYLWPTNPKLWGLGLIAVFVGAGALLLAFDALKSAVNILRTERYMRHYSRRGNLPKSARLASDDDLRDAGML